jgi:hypothetical protein
MAKAASVAEAAPVSAARSSQVAPMKSVGATDQVRRTARPCSARGAGELVMKRGEEARGDIGVVASLVARPDGTVRLVLDDVVIAPSTGMTLWRVRGSYTFIDWPRARVANMKLSPREYQTLGENLLARLLARRSTAGFVATEE